MAEKLTLKEKLVKSLEVKHENLIKKRKGIEEEHQTEMVEIKEKLDVIEMQLDGLKK